MAVFLAPAGSLLLSTGRWQAERRPLVVTAQVPPALPPVDDFALEPEPPAAVLGFCDAFALGCDDALALGLTGLAWANPVSMSELAAVAAIRTGIRAMPGRRFQFNVGPPRQIRRHHHHVCPSVRGSPCSHSMTTMSEIFHGRC
ncbi:MAG TPA: hypothetical protein VL652_11885, partial [Kutzneria sp.]|nr:hypothetical protein [Kutzneria sp.]